MCCRHLHEACALHKSTVGQCLLIISECWSYIALMKHCAWAGNHWGQMKITACNSYMNSRGQIVLASVWEQMKSKKTDRQGYASKVAGDGKVVGQELSPRAAHRAECALLPAIITGHIRRGSLAERLEIDCCVLPIPVCCKFSSNAEAA